MRSKYSNYTAGRPQQVSYAITATNSQLENQNLAAFGNMNHKKDHPSCMKIKQVSLIQSENPMQRKVLVDSGNQRSDLALDVANQGN